MTDDVVDQIAIAGKPDEVRDQLKAWEGLADHVLLYTPSVGLKAERVQENLDATVDTFAR